MILIFNTIIDPRSRANFTKMIAKRITFGKTFKILYLEDEICDFSEFSHLIISGSELSASTGSDWDKRIIQVIDSFINNGKAVLGICHGHQIIARAIAGERVCRKALKPEFGWKKMQIAENPLFKGITKPVFLESRYDEIYDLPADFKIIAWNESSGVQAFQYKDHPIWGVQFHPEMLFEDGSKMVDRHLDENPKDKVHYRNELQNKSKIDQNFLIFRNFLN